MRRCRWVPLVSLLFIHCAPDVGETVMTGHVAQISVAVTWPEPIPIDLVLVVASADEGPAGPRARVVEGVRSFAHALVGPSDGPLHELPNPVSVRASVAGRALTTPVERPDLDWTEAKASTLGADRFASAVDGALGEMSADAVGPALRLAEPVLRRDSDARWRIVVVVGGGDAEVGVSFSGAEVVRVDRCGDAGPCEPLSLPRFTTLDFHECGPAPVARDGAGTPQCVIVVTTPSGPVPLPRLDGVDRARCEDTGRPYEGPFGFCVPPGDRFCAARLPRLVGTGALAGARLDVACDLAR